MFVSTARRALVLGLAVCAAPLAQADYLWVERIAGQPAKAHLSAFQPGEHLPVAALLEPQVQLADGKNEALTREADGFAVVSAQPGDLRLSAKLPDGQNLTLYAAKEGRSETKAKADLELVPTTAGGNVFQLHWKGTVVSASQVNVYTSAQWSRVLKPAADGSVVLDTPFPGRYVLEVAAQINGSATADGKKYDSVTHVATVSFEVK